MSYDPTECNFFWGSHGCDLGANHEEEYHECSSMYYADDDEGTPIRETCCQHDGGTKVRFTYYGSQTWGEWVDYGAGWYGE